MLVWISSIATKRKGENNNGSCGLSAIPFADYLSYFLRALYFTFRSEWHKDYLKTLIDYDLADIVNIRCKDALEEMLSILAAWSSKFMDINAIGASLSLTKETLHSYVNWLLSLYIFDKVPPWLKTDYERVGKKAKIYASDTGLLTSILGWRIDEVMLDTDRSGKLMETFVFQELAALIDLENKYSLYHYRDREKREIDFPESVQKTRQ